MSAAKYYGLLAAILAGVCLGMPWFMKFMGWYVDWVKAL